MYLAGTRQPVWTRQLRKRVLDRRGSVTAQAAAGVIPTQYRYSTPERGRLAHKPAATTHVSRTQDARRKTQDNGSHRARCSTPARGHGPVAAVPRSKATAEIGLLPGLGEGGLQHAREGCGWEAPRGAGHRVPRPTSPTSFSVRRRDGITPASPCVTAVPPAIADALLGSLYKKGMPPELQAMEENDERSSVALLDLTCPDLT